MCPKVSVIVTAYNSGEYLSEAVQSVVRQTYKDYEILLVDDGSDAVHQAKIDELLARFPNIKLVRQENQGIAVARNVGVDRAQGEIIAFLDHDDLWDDRFLERLVGHLDNNPDLAVVFCRMEHIRMDGVKTGRFSAAKLRGLTVRDFLVGDPLCCGSAFLIRRDVFLALGGFEPEFRRVQMPQFFIRFLCAGYKVEGVEDVLTLYRNTPKSLSAGLASGHYRKRVLEDALQFKRFSGSVFLVRLEMLLNQFRILFRRALIG